MTVPQITLFDPPFIQVEGVCNFRSVGGYETSIDKNLRVKPNLLFRCGEINNITATGGEILPSLKIKKIIDLRAKTEVDKWKALPPALDGIEVLRIPVNQEANWDFNFLTALLRRLETDEVNAFLDMYAQYLENIAPSLEAAVRHIAEDPNHPMIVHCTAGKDRTGILVAIILLLLGVSEVDISWDYSLTEIGLKPMNELLAARLAKVSEAFGNNPVGTQNMGSSRAETMIAWIKTINDKYGSMEQFVLNHTNLTVEDLKAFRKSALVKV